MIKPSVAALCILLAGCGSRPKDVHPFMAGDPFKLTVGSIEPVIQEPVTLKDIKGHSFAAKDFEEALHLWVASTFVPMGQQGTLFITFEKAFIKEAPVKPQKTGIEAIFTKEPSSKLDGVIIAHFELQGIESDKGGAGHFTVERSTTLTGNLTLAERDAKIRQLYHDLISDLDQRIRSVFAEGLIHFTAF